MRRLCIWLAAPLIGIFCLTSLSIGASRVAPFDVQRVLPSGMGVEVALNLPELNVIADQAGSLVLSVLVSLTEVLELEVERFSLTHANTRFVIATASGERTLATPNVVLLRGKVAGQPGSHVYLGLGTDGSASGFILADDGAKYFLSTQANRRGEPGALTIHRQSSLPADPEPSVFCGVDDDEFAVRESAPLVPGLTDERAAPIGAAGLRVAELAIDADQAYVDLFPTVDHAAAYIVELYGAVSDIYARDMNIKLMLSFVRLWPDGGEPFSATDLSGFNSYWQANEDLTGLNLVQMLSGRRGLGYGGIGYVGGTCDQYAFSIAGYINGSFPSSLDIPQLGTWDLLVTAHEMGHNFGSLHTHTDPHIDDCGNGVPSRGTIMSYCHTHPGGTSNTDLRFHGLVQVVIEDEMNWGNCFWYDCNGNGIADSDDIGSGFSLDVNFNGIPDECEDCNGNSILDPSEGLPDVNGNGIPDVCEEDCNGNGLPDHYEIEQGMVGDQNGNDVPDECDPDCNANGIADFIEIREEFVLDYDNNNIPDNCQDCDGNGISDWLDLGREHNLFVADRIDYVREYHARSGKPIRNYTKSILDYPYDIVFGADRQAYVADFGNHQIGRIDVDAQTFSVFVAPGSGGLSFPSGLIFAPSGNLLVCSQGTNSVLEFDGVSGTYLGEFVTSGLGGLSQPYGLTFGSSNNLFVTSAGTNSVLEYDGATGALVGAFVSSGDGGLSDPRDVLFKEDGDLLVSSYASDQVLQYDGSSGAFVRVFNDLIVPTGAWGMTIGPDGLIYVVRSTGTIRILGYSQTGVYTIPFVRGDNLLPSPTSLAFRPSASTDLDGNYVLDVCDVCVDSDADGYGDVDQPTNTCVPDNCTNDYNPDQADADLDEIGDLCDACPNDFNNDIDGDAVCGDVDNCPYVVNPLQQDTDGDGLGDLCDECPLEAINDADVDGYCASVDNCPVVYNPNQFDIDGDGFGDLCDNCPGTYNPDQTDANGNGHGDVCGGCCDGTRGNVVLDIGTDCAAVLDQTTDVADLTNLIDHLFITFTAYCCIEEADIVPAEAPDGIVDVADLTKMIDFLFVTFDPVIECR